MPKQWALDPHWEAEQACQQEVASHFREFPSKWTPVGLYRDRNCNVRIIDHFKIERRPGQATIVAGDGKRGSEIIIDHVDLGPNVLSTPGHGFLDLGPVDCVHCDKIMRSVSLLPRDSLCKFGKDINIDGRLKAWLREDDRESLETVINWTLPQSSSVSSTNSAGVQGPPTSGMDAWPSSPTRSLKTATPAVQCHSENDADFAHEPSLWDSDLSVVLSHIPIERCFVEGCACEDCLQPSPFETLHDAA